ncbi:DUF680 domain-containing protein [Mesorhizobium loti]|uniref:DUF680 domain-containing protein n=1 Tax=Mesorhizobium loti R88b TaxID=935548 RepID=A0A6M7WPT8_RHILI|nr:DUF680 domain-containing protein [Mesorhizobium loti]QKD02813.1 DUF680 domain-containing protein [Mesorhizobium loti R88b]
MKNFTLTVAAILLATTGAFAGSDHFNADNQPFAGVDSNATASIPYTARQNKVGTKVKTGASQTAHQTDAGEFVGPPVPGN